MGITIFGLIGFPWIWRIFCENGCTEAIIVSLTYRWDKSTGWFGDSCFYSMIDESCTIVLPPHSERKWMSKIKSEMCVWSAIYHSRTEAIRSANMAGKYITSIIVTFLPIESERQKPFGCLLYCLLFPRLLSHYFTRDFESSSWTLHIFYRNVCNILLSGTWYKQWKIYVNVIKLKWSCWYECTWFFPLYLASFLSLSHIYISIFSFLYDWPDIRFSLITNFL